MSIFQFDHVIDRSLTNSIRWDKYGPGVSPLWVADMDFQPPEAVIQALKNRVEHGIFGYTYASPKLKEVIVDYVQRMYHWKIQPEWISFLPSVVTGLHLSVRMLTDVGDHLLIPHPAYHHFKDAALGAQRDFSAYDMHLRNGRYTFDISQLESLVRPQTKLIMLCNPHNPGGCVFTKPELETIAQFAKKHQLLICSDEIHADLILDEGIVHHPIGSIGQGVEQFSFSLMSLNKAYNFPGMGMSWLICPHPEIQKKIMKDVHTLIPNPNLFAYDVTQAAMEHGQEWHSALIQYLRQNRDQVYQRINAIPGLSMAHLQATYLAWIDCSAMGWPDPYEEFLKAGVALSPGAQFGDQQFVRLNFGTSSKILDQALDRIEKACRQ